MKNKISGLLLAAIMMCLSLSLKAQVVKGQLVDAESGEPLIGAAVIEQGTQNGTVTDIDGNFELKLNSVKSSLVYKYVGYKEKTQKTNAKVHGVTMLGVVSVESDSKILDDVIVSGTIAVARKTPVAVSSLPAAAIEEKLGTQEFPEVLKSTPGVHANKQGGGYGDSEIYMRGFDNTNVATMINGVPMNDMESGTVYWSNWAGLSDVTSTMQTQRGLGASKVSAPSVGGTINIITKGIDSKKGGSVSYAMGSDGMEKMLFTVSTGLTDSGWSVTLLGGRSQGDGVAQGLNYTGYNYFANIAKKINEHHSLSFTIFGAPQQHYQRQSYSALTISEWKRVEKQYGVTDYRYNADYGFDSNGQRKALNYNVYHKPQISLNHQWKINEKSNLSTSLYTSIGRGYGYSGEANGKFADANGNTWSYSNLRGAYNGQVLDTWRKADGTFDYAAIEDINANSQYGSLLVMSKSLNYHNWYGLLSTYSNKLTENIDFYGGVDFRYYNGHHANEIVDLYGGKYYMDEARMSINTANNQNAANPAWVYEKLGVGDVIYRNYDSYVVQSGVFFQTEYSKDNLSAFVSGAVNNTDYWREDKLYYDAAHAKSKNVNYWGGNIKGGANYNLNDEHNVFANVGFISRAPKFAGGAFMQYTTSNVTNKDAVNEKIFSVEAGYGYRTRELNVSLNGYYTNWMDKTMTKYITLNNQETGYMNMAGVDALHWGLELEAKYHPTKWVDVSGMFSWGDWNWNSKATGYVYDEHGQPVNSNGDIVAAESDEHAQATIDLKGIRVGGSAQTTANLGIDFKPMKGLKVGVDWTHYGRLYSYYSISSSNITVGKVTTVAKPWRVPSANLFDANASYRFKIGTCDAVLSGNVNNLLDYHYIVKAWNNSTASYANETNIYCFFNTGRTYSVRLKVNF